VEEEWHWIIVLKGEECGERVERMAWEKARLRSESIDERFQSVFGDIRRQIDGWC